MKRTKIPVTFFFSVLDNGVISNEFWTIEDVADDLSWGLIDYHGAARVGVTYLDYLSSTFRVLVNTHRDGSIISYDKLERIYPNYLYQWSVKDI